METLSSFWKLSLTFLLGVKKRGSRLDTCRHVSKRGQLPWHCIDPLILPASALLFLSGHPIVLLQSLENEFLSVEVERVKSVQWCSGLCASTTAGWSGWTLTRGLAVAALVARLSHQPQQPDVLLISGRPHTLVGIDMAGTESSRGGLPSGRMFWGLHLQPCVQEGHRLDYSRLLESDTRIVSAALGGEHLLASTVSPGVFPSNHVVLM